MKGLFHHQILSFWNYEKPIWKNTVHMHFMLEHILEQISFLIAFTPCKTEQPLQGMELQEKKCNKIKAKEICLERTYIQLKDVFKF